MINLLQTNPLWFTIACGIIGLLVGSFLNVVIYRLPKMMMRDWQIQCAELNQSTVADAPALTLSTPHSSCPQCGHAIRAVENIPIISYLWLRGKCASCHTAISIRYPVVELVTGLLSAYTASHFGYGLAAISAILFVWALIALTFIDFDTQLLPDSIILPLLWLGLLVNMQNTFAPLPTALVGAMLGYLSLWSVYWLFKLLTGKEGMGYGDFKLLAAIGAWLGWSILPIVILLSSVVGAIVGIVLMVIAKRGRAIPIPFGPYLAGGGLIALFWGQDILNTYLTTLT
ncbi:MAG: prepilin peptidase [Sulfuriferula sp.]|nr:prepilin peptidase [Sulfuriferula sp.]